MNPELRDLERRLDALVSAVGELAWGKQHVDLWHYLSEARRKEAGASVTSSPLLSETNVSYAPVASDPTHASGLRDAALLAGVVAHYCVSGGHNRGVDDILSDRSAVLDAFVKFCQSESRRIGIVPEIACAAHDFKERNNLP